jgi:hypothetical protein
VKNGPEEKEYKNKRAHKYLEVLSLDSDQSF